MAQQYGISVSIFDGKWFSFAVFEQGCLDIAIEKLNFSDEYRKKTIKIGPNDKERKSELNKIEDDLIKHTVADLVVFMPLGFPFLRRKIAERRQVAMLPRAHGFELF